MGFIKLYRSLLENPIFDNSELLRVWIWCLLKASYFMHYEMVGKQKIELLPGQFIFGRKKASEELKIGESKLYRIMKLLESENQIELNSNNRFTIVNIINWSFYQGLEMNNKQQKHNKKTTNGHYIRSKEIKNIKNVGSSYDIELYEQMLNKKV